MCFSASSSFSVSVALTVIGAILINKTKANRFLLLALIPWFFAIQQFFEGMLWLYLPDQKDLWIATVAKNIFLFFSFIFWPIWIPLSFFIAEKKRTILGIILGMGIVIGMLLGVIIPYMDVSPHCFSISYFSILERSYPVLHVFSLFFYGITTIGPLLISKIKKMWCLGIVGGAAAIAIYAIDSMFFISLWCFIAAVLSIFLLYILPKKT